MAQPSEKRGTTVETVSRIVEPIARELQLELWDIRYEKEGSAWYLRIFIDKPGGVNIDDCEALSRAVDKPIEDADPIPESYFLEVSSPGIDRLLLRPEHFSTYMGSNVVVRLIRPENGVREFTGKLLAYEGGTLTLETANQGLFTFDKKQTAFVRLCVDYKSGGVQEK